MCGYFGVTRSAYYRWLKHPISGNERENGELCALIRQIHTAHPDMGYRRIRDELAARYGRKVNDKRVLRLCRKLFDMPEDCRTLNCGQLNALAKQLCRGDKSAADLILRYEPERIHTLVPGVMILVYLADWYGVKAITVSHYGVREGYLRRKIQPSMLKDNGFNSDLTQSR